MKKILSFIIAMLLLLGLCTGCQSGDQGQSDGNASSGASNSPTENLSDTADTSSKVESGVSINGVGLSKFTIIRPNYNLSYIAQLQIEELIKSVAEDYSCTLKLYNDNEASDLEYEIIVGNSNREGVESLINRDEYSIKISGKKVYLNGGSVQSTAMAVSEFTKMLKNGNLTDSNSIMGSSEIAMASYDKSKYYTYVWGDDFDGTHIDTSKWYVAPEGKFDAVGMNGRKSIRTDDPNYVFVYDSKFHISAGYTKDKYIGGMITSHRHMLYRYGYLEMSAILPNGKGLWTALWLDTRGHTFWPTPEESAGVLYDSEIDINECFGNAKTVAANVHKWPTEVGTAAGHKHTSLDGEKYGNDKKYSLEENGATFNDGFHTFGLLWDEDEHTFTCDGKVYFTYKNNTTEEDRDGLHALSFIKLSAAIGFETLGEVAADDDPAWKISNQFIIDYVHIYQLENDQQILLTQ